jgi:hypothetical protein
MRENLRAAVEESARRTTEKILAALPQIFTLSGSKLCDTNLFLWMSARAQLLFSGNIDLSFPSREPQYLLQRVFVGVDQWHY